jgi:hypothetical protein
MVSCPGTHSPVDESERDMVLFGWGIVRPP